MHAMGTFTKHNVSSLHVGGIPYYLIAKDFVESDDYATTFTHGFAIYHRQVYHMFPSLKFAYPFEAENSFDAYPYLTFAKDHPIIPVLTCCLYLLLVRQGTAEHLIRDRKPRALKTSLMLWNLFLAVFSFVGAMRVVPHLLGNWLENGFGFTVCAKSYGRLGSGNSGLEAIEAYGMGPSGLCTQIYIKWLLYPTALRLYIVVKTYVLDVNARLYP
jgi:hypothetical protein